MQSCSNAAAPPAQEKIYFPNQYPWAGHALSVGAISSSQNISLTRSFPMPGGCTAWIPDPAAATRSALSRKQSLSPTGSSDTVTAGAEHLGCLLSTLTLQLNFHPPAKSFTDGKPFAFCSLFVKRAGFLQKALHRNQP